MTDLSRILRPILHTKCVYPPQQYRTNPCTVLFILKHNTTTTTAGIGLFRSAFPIINERNRFVSTGNSKPRTNRQQCCGLDGAKRMEMRRKCMCADVLTGLESRPQRCTIVGGTQEVPKTCWKLWRAVRTPCPLH